MSLDGLLNALEQTRAAYEQHINDQIVCSSALKARHCFWRVYVGMP